MTATFTLPPGAEATAPPGVARAWPRDEVRLHGRPPRRRRPRAASATCPTCSSPATSSWSTPRPRCPARLRRRRADGVVVPLHWSTHAGRRQLGGRAAPSGQQRPGPRRRARHGARRCPAASGCTLLDRLSRTRPGRPGCGGPAPTPPVATTAYLPRARARRSGYGYLRGRRSRWPTSRTSTPTEPGSAGDGQRRPAVHRASCWSRLMARGVPVVAAGAAHRRLQPGAARAAVPRSGSPSRRSPPGW